MINVIGIGFRLALLIIGLSLILEGTETFKAIDERIARMIRGKDDEF